MCVGQIDVMGKVESLEKKTLELNKANVIHRWFWFLIFYFFAQREYKPANRLENRISEEISEEYVRQFPR